MKIWNEVPLDEDVKALLALMEGKIVYWWDPFARGWGVCQVALRFRRGMIHRTVPHPSKLRRWQHELAGIMRELQIPASEF